MKRYFFTLFFSCIFCTLYAVESPQFEKTCTFFVSTEKSIDEVAKIVCSISTLEGVQYYSHREGKWDVLYSRAGFIESPQNHTILSDSYCKNMQQTYYCLLDDNSLGDCVFQIKYVVTDKSAQANLLLVEPIMFWGITAVEKNKLSIHIQTEKIDKGYSVSLKISADYQNLPFFENRLNQSFEARLDALNRWIAKAIRTS